MHGLTFRLSLGMLTHLQTAPPPPHTHVLSLFSLKKLVYLSVFIFTIITTMHINVGQKLCLKACGRVTVEPCRMKNTSLSLVFMKACSRLYALPGLERVTADRLHYSTDDQYCARCFYIPFTLLNSFQTFIHSAIIRRVRKTLRNATVCFLQSVLRMFLYTCNNSAPNGWIIFFSGILCYAFLQKLHVTVGFVEIVKIEQK